MQYFSSAQAAEYLKVTQACILTLIKNKRLTATRVFIGPRRKGWRITQEALDAAIIHKAKELPRNADGSIQQVNVTGLCMCGCGKPVTVATHTSFKKGIIRGQLSRFIQGHNGRALSKVQYIVNEVTGCWIWQRFKDDGYGRIFGGKKAHRVFYERKHGPIPDGKVLDHLCRNRACVNPDHLEAVTQSVNKRRQPNTILNPEKVKEIRKRLLSGHEMQKDIAPRFGVSQSTISNVAVRKTWKDV